MNKGVFLIAMIPLLLGCYSCRGTKNAEETSQENLSSMKEDLSPREFNRIYIQGAMDVVYTTDRTCCIKIKGPKKDVDRISAHVSDGSLLLSGPHHHLSGLFNKQRRLVTVYVASPALNEVDMRGIGKFSAKNKIMTGDFKVALSGTGNISLEDIVCTRFVSGLSGTGNLMVHHLTARSSSLDCSGTGNAHFGKLNIAGNTDINLSGTGSMTAEELSARGLSVQTNGTGSAALRQIEASDITASTSGAGSILLCLKKGGNVDISASGVGGITVRGTYQHLRQHSSGLGHIHLE